MMVGPTTSGAGRVFVAADAPFTMRNRGREPGERGMRLDLRMAGQAEAASSQPSGDGCMSFVARPHQRDGRARTDDVG